MSKAKPVATPLAHLCPCCHLPQTRIKRVLEGGKFGSTNFICAHTECALGIELAKLTTWVSE